MAYIIVMHFSCMTICVWVVFKGKVEKNLKMIAVLKSVEGQASCTDEHYLCLINNLINNIDVKESMIYRQPTKRKSVLYEKKSKKSKK